MIKVFTQNKDGKIEFTKKELKELLDEAYWDGYNTANRRPYWTYTTPTWTPYYWTASSSGNSYTISSSSTSGTIPSDSITTNNSGGAGCTATTVKCGSYDGDGVATIYNSKE